MFSATMTGPDTEKTDPFWPSSGPSVFFDAIVRGCGGSGEADKGVVSLLLAVEGEKLESGLESGADECDDGDGGCG